jgi:hypothetical protein
MIISSTKNTKKIHFPKLATRYHGKHFGTMCCGRFESFGKAPYF